MNMNEYRLVIVDSDADCANRTARFLSGTARFRIVGTAADGAAALKMVKTVKPDVVLLDPLLPGIDGLCLMKAIRTLKCSPVVICISEAYTSFSLELARRNGASYYLYKPVELESLAQVLTECCTMAVEKRKLESACEEISHTGEISRRIHSLLCELGFSFKLSGSEYIAKSVELAMESPMALHNFSTGIYPTMAEWLHVSPACIERSMRTAIAFADSDGKLTAKIGARPTNKTCIRYLLHALELQP